mmetsp:Transcript_6520/g.21600  ORF Transcript_6520/g.21600 Transcript_6520/m.21600 type:complete len:365 (+) Transcript_6520:137-1231(+)
MRMRDIQDTCAQRGRGHGAHARGTGRPPPQRRDALTRGGAPGACLGRSSASVGPLEHCSLAGAHVHGISRPDRRCGATQPRSIRTRVCALAAVPDRSSANGPAGSTGTARGAGSARLLSLWPFAVLLLLLLHLGHHLLEPRLAAEVLEHLRVHLVHHLCHSGGVHVVQILPRLAHLFVLLDGLLHRGRHQLELVEQLDHLERVVPRSAGDAEHARLGEAFCVVQLGVRHRVHHGEPLLDPGSRLVEVQPAHPGELIHDVRERAHLEHRLELLPHVAQRPVALRQPLHHLRRLLLQVHVRGAHLLHQARDVALAEHARHKRLDLEVLEVLNMLARADVRDWSAGRRHRRKRPATLGVAVQLGDDD